MNHVVLATKWRPKNFEELVGQEHVLRSLINALNQKRIHPAYLFTGTRGIGKTTLGRILTRALSCKQGISATPCNQCQHCEAILQGKFSDFIEIDAASHTKVEDIRELLSSLPYAPAEGPFKIYLIDEIHMLSNHSFNALLKTLEEPPPHVIFIFATTDPQRLPETVLSRCLQFGLIPLTEQQIAAQLTNILNKEQVSFEPEALCPISKAAEGSMRDALTILQQAIAYSPNRLTAKDVCSLLGVLSTDHLLALLEALQQQNADTLMALTRQLAEQSIDFQAFLQSLATYIHHIILIKMAPMAIELTFEESISSRLTALSLAFTLDELHKFYQILISGQQDLSIAPTPRIGAEMTLLRLLAVNFIKAKHHPVPKPVSVSLKTPTEVKRVLPSTASKETTPAGVNHADEEIKAIMKAFNAKLLKEEKT